MHVANTASLHGCVPWRNIKSAVYYSLHLILYICESSTNKEDHHDNLLTWGNDSAPYSEVSPKNGAKLQGHEVKQKKWVLKLFRWLLCHLHQYTSSPSTHAYTCYNWYLLAHSWIFFCARHTTLRGILLCAVYNSAQHTTLRGIQLCAAYYSVQYTTLRSILLCVAYYSARHTTLRGIQLCAAYYSVRYTTLRSILLCVAYYSARHTTLRGILLCAVYYSAWHTYS